MKKLFIFLFLTCFIGLLNAQNNRWSIGLKSGGMFYSGDLVPKAIYLSETKPAFGLVAGTEVISGFVVNAGLLTGKISGDDSNFDTPTWRRQRAFLFSSSITEFTLDSQWHPLAMYSKNSLFSPYLFGGIGVVCFNPDPEFKFNKLPDLEQRILKDQAGTYNTSSFIIPLGLGTTFKLSENWSLGLEAGIRISFTDYLDGISEAAEVNTNDGYSFVGVSVHYLFGEKDSDGDGVKDMEDACPAVPGKVSLKGCPDSDEDGIADQMDACPEEAGLESLRGCPDTDGDGIANNMDLCPNEFGLPSRNGCPEKDSDGDGIEDFHDECPKIAGPPDNKGCPLVDSDKDGIWDQDDRCPNDFGLKVFKGCPDTDGDGIEDAKDRCPTLFGIFANNGCPEGKGPEDEALELQNSVLRFGSNNAEIKSYAVLEQLFAFMKKNPEYHLLINAYKEKTERRTALAEERAKACFDYFIRKGLDPERFQTKSLFTPPSDIEGLAHYKIVQFKLFKAQNGPN